MNTPFFRYIRAEVRRILSKKSLYIVAGVCLAGFLALILSTQLGKELTTDSVTSNASSVMMLVAMVGGSIVFATVYCDDLASKALSQVIGFGRGKTTIVLAKLLLLVLLSALLVLFATLVIMGTYACLGISYDLATIQSLSLTALQAFMLVVGFGALVSVLVYGVQRSNVAITSFALLSTGLISQLFMMLLMVEAIYNLFGDLTQYTLFPIVNRFMEQVSFVNFYPFAIYVFVFTILAIFVFRKKELEF